MKTFVATLALAVAGPSLAASDTIQIAPNGATPTRAGNAEQFTGQVLIDGLTTADSAKFAGSGIVTFAPGARTAWHTHPAGQWFFVTSGKGWVQEEGRAAREIKPGDAVWIPANVKHWHGATDKTSMSHIAITPVQDGKNVTWLDPVSDAQYGPR